MKLATIQFSIDAVRDLDGGARIRRARAEAMKAKRDLTAEEESHAKLGSMHVQRLRRVMTNAMKPHRIEWDDFNTGLSIDGRDNKSSIWLRGKISPATTGPRFASSLRVTLPFDMHPASAEQFANQVRALKAGADAIQQAGY
jgi:hypothetical protein